MLHWAPQQVQTHLEMNLGFYLEYHKYAEFCLEMYYFILMHLKKKNSVATATRSVDVFIADKKKIWQMQ